MQEVDEPAVNMDHVEIDAKQVTINQDSAWTPNMVKWNTIGTVGGFFVSLVSVLTAVIMIWMSMHGVPAGCGP